MRYKIIARELLRYIALPRRWPGADDRSYYQKQYVDFGIKPTDKVLDIGSGPFPSPRADVHADFYPLHEGVVQCDVMAMPFADKEFDFSYCAHTLEHVIDPIKACKELIRVSKRGYIETPTITHDIMFSWGYRAGHRWGVMGLGNILIFVEYTERQRWGVRSTLFEGLIMSKFYNSLQRLYFDNQDVWNTMFLWDTAFEVWVFRLGGKVEKLSENCK